MRRFEIISTGEELLSGALVDTNSPWLCDQVRSLGLASARVTLVGDVLPDIVEVLRGAAGRAAVVVVTGGLGPTTDDWSREAAAEAFDRPLMEDPLARLQVEARYRSRGREPTPICWKQALIPVGATLLENRWGTAPGFMVEAGASLVFFFPGVPGEMKKMVAEHLVPLLRVRFPAPPLRTIVIRTMGLAESEVGRRMVGFEWPGVTVGYRAAMPEVQLKLHVEPAADADAALADALGRIGASVYGVDTGPLAEVLGNMLRLRGHTVSVAESCTGGKLGAMLTSVPGASDYHLGGALVYSNAEKVRQCGVPPEMFAEHGAVSEPVARALAEGIRSQTGSTWGIGVTGVAGPGGGSEDKPVGTVYISVAGPEVSEVRRLSLPGDRDRVTTFAAAYALDLLRRILERTPG